MATKRRVKKATRPPKVMAARRRRSTRTRTRTVYRTARRKASSGVRGIGGIFRGEKTRKILMGVGAGQVTQVITARVMPQYSTPASLIAGFLAGGIWGGAANALLNGGLQALTGGGLGGLFGGSPAQTQMVRSL